MVVQRRYQVSLNEALKSLGDFGRFQFFVLMLLFPVNMFQGAKMTANVLLLDAQNHRCAIPGINDTYEVAGEEHAMWYNKTIPNGDSCHMFDPNRTYKYDAYNKPINASGHLVGCIYGYVYDTREMKYTATSKFNLVCDKSFYPSYANTLLYVGALFGSTVFGFASDRFGRLACFLFSVLLYLVSGIAMAWSPNFAVLGICQFLGGAASIGMFSNAIIMGIELVGAKYRKYSGIVFQIFFPLGELVTGGVAYWLRNWKWVELIITVPAVFLLSYYWLVPESLRWLMSKRRLDEMGRVLCRAAKWNGTELPYGAETSEDMAQLLRGYDAENDDDQDPIANDERKDIQQVQPRAPDTLWRLFTSKILCIRTCSLFVIWFCSMLTFFGFIFNSGTLVAGNVILNFILGALMEIPAHLTTLFLVDKLGRKPVFISFLVFSAVSSAAAIVMVFKAHEDEAWVILLLSCLGRYGATGIMSTSFLWTPELFPTSTRSTAFGLCISFARLGAITSSYLVHYGMSLHSKTGHALPFIVFCCSAGLTLLLVVKLPETHNRKLPETIEEAEKFTSKRRDGYERI